MRVGAAALLVVAVMAVGCGDGGDAVGESPGIGAPSTIKVSGAFENGGAVPEQYTCDGANVSPEIRWSGDSDAREFALIMTDPDAPGGTFVHWVVYGIPSAVRSLQQDAIPQGAVEGRNSFGDVGYAGPCPPEGDDPHGYDFIVYALGQDVSQRLDAEATADELLTAIECCVDAQGTLVGTYAR